jgi:hypothetical protein
VSDDQEVVLLALEFQNDGFETDSEIVVRLVLLVRLEVTRIDCEVLTSARGYL